MVVTILDRKEQIIFRKIFICLEVTVLRSAAGKKHGLGQTAETASRQDDLEKPKNGRITAFYIFGTYHEEHHTIRRLSQTESLRNLQHLCPGKSFTLMKTQ